MLPKYMSVVCSVLCLSAWTRTPVFALSDVENDKWSKKYFAGVTTQKNKDFAAANRFFADALAEAEKFDKRDPRLQITIRAAAMCYSENNKTAESEALYNRLLTLREQVFGKNYPRVADACIDLGKLLLEHGECSRAQRVRPVIPVVSICQTAWFAK